MPPFFVRKYIAKLEDTVLQLNQLNETLENKIKKLEKNISQAKEKSCQSKSQKPSQDY